MHPYVCTGALYEYISSIMLRYKLAKHKVNVPAENGQAGNWLESEKFEFESQ